MRHTLTRDQHDAVFHAAADAATTKGAAHNARLRASEVLSVVVDDRNAPTYVSGAVLQQAIAATQAARDALEAVGHHGTARPNPNRPGTLLPCPGCQPREVVVTGWDGVSNPIYRYRDELHLSDHMRSTVHPEDRPRERGDGT